MGKFSKSVVADGIDWLLDVLCLILSQIIYCRVIVHGREDLDFIHVGFLLIHMQKFWQHFSLVKASDRSVQLNA
jgi:hypothetical protein